MQEFNFPTSLWVHGKEKPPDESVFELARIEGEDWFDERLRKTCQVEALSPLLSVFFND